LAKSDKTQPDKTKPLVGGVEHDARGNAVWRWASETARHAAVSTSQLLRRLDVSSLSLEDEQPSGAQSKPVPAKPAPTQSAPTRHSPNKSAPNKPVAPVRKAHGGFNPYDGAAIPRAAGPKKQAPVSARPRPSWWRRLFQRR
jgi:hypothetical protein